MVDYNADENALELGDEDSLKVGDYELEYNPTSDDYEIVHPNGEVSNIPRNTSGSVVPQGLAESVSAGEVLADDGETYTSVQSAVDAATGWVFVGPGTFTENVTISTAGLTLEGCGEDTLIDGGTTGHAINITSDNVTIQNVSVQTTSGDENSFNGIYDNGGGISNATINSVIVQESSSVGIHIGLNGTTNCKVINCLVKNTDNTGINIRESSIVSSCIVNSSGNDGIYIAGHDTIVCNNITENVDRISVFFAGSSNDSIAVGNRLINSGDHGILVDSNDNIIANNRVSGSTNADIDDGGTGTVLDDNLTGPSN